MKTLDIATLWLVTEDKELLLQKRALTRRLHPGEWGPSVTGTKDGNETTEQTLAREVEEEFGLSPTDYRPIFLWMKEFMHEDGNIRRFSIHGALVPKEISEKFVLDSKEVAETKWFPIQTIRDMLAVPDEKYKIVPSAKEVWPETFAKLEQEFFR